MNEYTPRTPAGQAMTEWARQMRSGIETNFRQCQIKTAINLFQQTQDARHLAAAKVTIVANRFRADETDYGAVS